MFGAYFKLRKNCLEADEIMMIKEIKLIFYKNILNNLVK
jgi:hypothetical protein